MSKKQRLELDRVEYLHEALARFVRRIGEAQTGSFGVSMPGSVGARLLDVEFDFAGYRDRCLRKHFKSGVWICERQENTGDWHIHAAVDLGFDGQSGFPFEAVKNKSYVGVSAKFRKLWKALRDGAAETGYGISNIMPMEAGTRGRLVTYNRPYLMPLRPGTSERFISYLSGRALDPAYQKHFRKPPPEGCGSWGWEGAIKI